MVELKNRVKQHRWLNGEMTQQELADRLGVSRQTILAVEKGKFNPSTRLALQMAQILNTSVEELFYLDGGE